MASYLSSLSNWISSKPNQAHPASQNGPKTPDSEAPQIVINGSPEDLDKTPRPSTENRVDDDEGLTMFPAPDSAQRISTSAGPSLPSVTPPSPVLESPSNAASMPPPPVPERKGSLSSLSPLKSFKQKKQKKHALAPGHSPLDWAILKTKGLNLRGTETLLRVTPSELAKHNTKEDAWAVFFGKVYNITPYMSYHPGGEKRLMKVAGRDGTRQFVKSHEWVSIDGLMDECMVGFLVPEPRD